MPDGAPTIASTCWRCISPRLVSAAATRLPGCGSTNTARPLCRALRGRGHGFGAAQLHAGCIRVWPDLRRERDHATSVTGTTPRWTSRLIAAELERVMAPLSAEDGIPPEQMEYKVRRLVNDYLQPPKVTKKMEIGLSRILQVREDLAKLHAGIPTNCCAPSRCIRLSTAPRWRPVPRWGARNPAGGCTTTPSTTPSATTENWFCHSRLYKGEDGDYVHRYAPGGPLHHPAG